MTLMTLRQHAYTLFVGSLALTLGLLPTLFDQGAVVPLETSLPVSTVLGLYGLSFLALKQWVPASGMIGQATVWAMIALWRH